MTALERCLAGLLLPTVLFVSKANNIIIENFADLPYDVWTMLGFVGAFVLAAAVTVPLFLHSTRRRLYAILARACVALAVALLLWGVVTTVTAYRVRRFAVSVTLDEVVFLVACIVAARLPFPLLMRLCSFVAAGLLVQGVGTHAMKVWSHRAAFPVAAHVASAGTSGSVAPTRPSGNVYHLMLDGFQREAFTILRERDATLHPPGFTFYPRFFSSYFLTEHAMAAVVTGRYLGVGEDRAAWVGEMAHGGLWGDLSASGVRVTQYPISRERYCLPGAAGGCFPSSELASDRVTAAEHHRRLSHAQRATVDYWCTSLLPRSLVAYLRRDYLADGELTPLPPGGEAPAVRLSRLLFPGAEDGGGPVVGVEAAAYWGVRNFERLLEEEAARSATGQYVYFHAVLPHFPYVVGDDCGRVASRMSLDAYLAQGVCGLRLVHRLTDRLAELGRLDEALIIVHSDHGGLLQFLDDFAQEYPGHCAPDMVAELATPEQVRAGRKKLRGNVAYDYPGAVAMRSGGLLLVKFPGAETRTDTTAPAQLVDIRPTILHHVGLPVDQSAGYPLDEIPADGTRPDFFFLGPKSQNEIKAWQEWDRAGVFHRYERLGDVWTFAGEHAAR